MLRIIKALKKLHNNIKKGSIDNYLQYPPMLRLDASPSSVSQRSFSGVDAAIILQQLERNSGHLENKGLPLFCLDHPDGTINYAYSRHKNPPNKIPAIMELAVNNNHLERVGPYEEPAIPAEGLPNIRIVALYCPKQPTKNRFQIYKEAFYKTYAELHSRDSEMPSENFKMTDPSRNK